MISLESVSKTYRISRRDAGFSQAVRSLFHREYTYIKALDNVSFTVNDGEMVGYIGPNGAGKSSTIKVMSGILTPDSGSCTVDGITPWKNRKAHVKNIGVVFGQRSQLWWDVPVIDSFELLKDIYAIPESVYKKNISELTELLDLSQILRTPARQLSLGQRMRCEISASLLHDPKVLFLDEPTIGLDAVSKIAVRDFIRTVGKEKKTTVILTTHDMQDIEALTDRIILIGKGRILLDGGFDELKRRGSRIKTITVEYTEGSFFGGEGITVKEQQNGRTVYQLDPEIIPVPEAVRMLTENLSVTDISVEGQSTDDMVVSLYNSFSI